MKYLSTSTTLGAILLGLMVISTVLICDCQTEDTGEPATSGQDTLASDPQSGPYGDEIPGFDFSQARIRYEFPQAQSHIVDIALQVQVNGSNQGIGGIFSLPGQFPVFQSMGPIPLSEILEAPESGYFPQVAVSPGFSYCVVTAENKYAKLYIVDMDFGNRSEGQPYVWIRFDWVFQPDGSRGF
jgi:hypothetical protein